MNDFVLFRIKGKMMRKLLLTVISAFSICMTTSAFAGTEYNDVPAGDPQVKACKIFSMKRWEGGGESSKIDGQSNAEAFCTCLWNETPDDFKGDLAKFSETAKGASTNKICEKYSGWGS